MATLSGQKEITTVLGEKVYYLTAVSNTDTFSVPFGTIHGVHVTNNTAASTAVITASWSGSTITFAVSAGAVDATLTVWGK